MLGRTAVVDLAVAISYGDPAHQVAREIQRQVTATLRDQVGLQDVTVNVTIDDVLDDDADTVTLRTARGAGSYPARAVAWDHGGPPGRAATSRIGHPRRLTMTTRGSGPGSGSASETEGAQPRKKARIPAPVRVVRPDEIPAAAPDFAGLGFVHSAGWRPLLPIGRERE